MGKQFTTWIVPFVIGIISSIVAGWLLNNIWIMTSLMLVTFLSLIAMMIYKRTEVINKVIAQIKDSSFSPPPQCCGLHLAGFSQVYENADQSRSLSIDLVSKNYKFLGVSAFHVLKTHGFKNTVIRKTKEQNCNFQIVLLDPDMDEVIEKHANKEGSTKEAISLQIKTCIAELRTLAAFCSEKLEVWTYQQLPIFRLVIVDEERIFVNFYGIDEEIGPYSPQLVFLKTDRSFYIAFSRLYQNILSSAKRVI